MLSECTQGNAMSVMGMFVLGVSSPGLHQIADQSWGAFMNTGDCVLNLSSPDFNVLTFSEAANLSNVYKA